MLQNGILYSKLGHNTDSLSLIGRYWCHLRDTGTPRRGHSRESGNPFCNPMEMRRGRTGFPLSRE
jgi:hypothetical protein